MNHNSHLFSSCALGLAFLAGTPAVFGADLPFFSRMDIIDTWGSVLYCQAIYEEPDVKGRIYAGDVQACDKAHELMVDLLRRDYAPDEGQEIAQEAVRKASAIRYNTRSAQDAVGACRQQCRKLAAMQEENGKSVEKAGNLH